MKVGDMTLVNPWFLLLLALIPVYLYWVYGRKSTSSLSMGLPQMTITSIRSWRVVLYRLMPIVLSISFALVVFALARPVETFQKQKITSEGIDIICAVDLSSSMLAKDFEPNRLQASKEVIKEFIEKRPGDRIGLTAFAGESYTACPPTLDHRVLQDFIDGLDFGQIKDGTAIGMGISSSLNRLMDSEATSKIIILITDGKNTSGAVDPLDAADIAQELGIKIYTIGVGTNGQALMPYRNFGGEMKYTYQRVEIDEQLLNAISERTGGVYFRAKNEAELSQIYDYIDDLEKSEFDSNTITRKDDQFFPYLLSGLFGLSIYFGLFSSIFRNLDEL